MKNHFTTGIFLLIISTLPQLTAMDQKSPKTILPFTYCQYDDLSLDEKIRLERICDNRWVLKQLLLLKYGSPVDLDVCHADRPTDLATDASVCNAVVPNPDTCERFDRKQFLIHRGCHTQETLDTDAPTINKSRSFLITAKITRRYNNHSFQKIWGSVAPTGEVETVFRRDATGLFSQDDSLKPLAEEGLIKKLS